MKVNPLLLGGLIKFRLDFPSDIKNSIMVTKIKLKVCIFPTENSKNLNNLFDVKIKISCHYKD